MRGITHQLKQIATVWPTTPDGFGGYLFGSPYTARCRWEDRSELYFGRISGKEEVTRAVVFVDQDLNVGDWIALDDNTDVQDPSILVGAFPVKDFSSIPDLRSMIRVRKVRL